MILFLKFCSEGLSESCFVGLKYSAVHRCVALHIRFKIITALSFAFVSHEQIVLLESKSKYASIRTKMRLKS